VGLEEPRKAGGGVVRDGASGQQEHHAETARVAAIPSAGESQDLGKQQQPDRDAQFEHINAAAIAMQAAGKPVISIDTKKKEPIGPYKKEGLFYARILSPYKARFLWRGFSEDGRRERWACASAPTSSRLRSAERMIHGAPLQKCCDGKVWSLIMRGIVEGLTANSSAASSIVTSPRSALSLCR